MPLKDMYFTVTALKQLQTASDMKCACKYVCMWFCAYVFMRECWENSRSNSSSSRWWCGPSLSFPAGLQCSGNPSPADSRHGRPACTSRRGTDRPPSKPHTPRTSHHWWADRKTMRDKTDKIIPYLAMRLLMIHWEKGPRAHWKMYNCTWKEV